MNAKIGINKISTILVLFDFILNFMPPVQEKII